MEPLKMSLHYFKLSKNALLRQHETDASRISPNTYTIKLTLVPPVLSPRLHQQSALFQVWPPAQSDHR